MEEKKSGKSKGKKKSKKKKEKTKEIKELKYKTIEEIRELEKKENESQSIESIRAYLEKYCTPIIQEAMISCAKERPINPIEYIGNYLLERAHGK